MSDLLLAHRQRAYLLEHELWVAQRTDGKWQLWIEGKRPLQHCMVFQYQAEAKRVVHSLAHWHLEGKHFCDCPTELLWELVRLPDGISQEERRKARRFTYFCDISFDDQGIINVGHIRNLSSDGAFIQTFNPASQGAVLTLNFQVGPVQIETQGKVVMCINDNYLGTQNGNPGSYKKP